MANRGHQRIFVSSHSNRWRCTFEPYGLESRIAHKSLTGGCEQQHPPRGRAAARLLCLPRTIYPGQSLLLGALSAPNSRRHLARQRGRRLGQQNQDRRQRALRLDEDEDEDEDVDVDDEAAPSMHVQFAPVTVGSSRTAACFARSLCYGDGRHSGFRCPLIEPTPSSWPQRAGRPSWR